MNRYSATMPAPVPVFAADSYQLIGRIVRSGGISFRKVRPVIFLQGVRHPYSSETSAEVDGRFKFKKLSQGTYILILAVPRFGELRKTVEVGPAFADSAGRVTLTISLEGTERNQEPHTITTAELHVSVKARQQYEKALEKLERHDTSGAVECLRKAVEIDPEYAAAWNYLGTIAYQTGRQAEAERHFREALKQDPDLYSALVNLGGALLAQSKFEESLPVNQRAAKARPDDPLAHSQLALSYYYTGSYDEAETQLRQAKALEAGHFSSPQLFLAEIYLRRNQPSAAIGEIEEFLRLHPDSDKAPELRKKLDSLRAAPR